MGKDKASKDEVCEDSRTSKEEQRPAKHEIRERLRRLSSDFDKTDDEGNPKKHRFKKAIAATVGAARKLGKKKSRRERQNVIHIEEPPLSEHEKQQVSDFRTMLQEAELLPARHDDYHTLLRFIRARKHDLVAAKEMWAKYIQWRQEFGTDTIEKDFTFDEVEQVKEHYPQGHHGVDREGCPIYIELIGKVDAHKVLKYTTVERYLKYHVKEFERMFSVKFPAASIACGRHVETSTSIMDAEGVGFKSLNKTARALIQAIAAIDGNYYPETMKRMLIINAGPALRSIWAVVKGWIDPVTVKKITVLGTRYQKELFEYIDPSQLPHFLGGTCRCDCPGGCLSSDKGPWTDPTILQQLALQRAAQGRLGNRFLGSRGSDAFGHSTDDDETEDERSPQLRKEASLFRQLSGLSRNDSNIPESGDEAQSARPMAPHLATILSNGVQLGESSPADDRPSMSPIEVVAAAEYRRLSSKESRLKPISPKPTPLELPDESRAVVEKGMVSDSGGELRDAELPGTSDSATVKLKASSWGRRRSLSGQRGVAESPLGANGGAVDDRPALAQEGVDFEKRGQANPLSRYFLTQLVPALVSLWSFCVRQLSVVKAAGVGVQKGGVDEGLPRGEKIAGERELDGTGAVAERLAGLEARAPDAGALASRLASLEAQVRTLTVSLTRPNSPERPPQPFASDAAGSETHKKVESLELELHSTKQEIRRLLSKQNELESLIKEMPSNRKFACF